MKSVAMFALCLAACALALKADDTAKLDDLGTYFDAKNGQFTILLTGDHAVWQNGRRLPYEPYPECGMMNQVFLKAGDTLFLGGEDGFSRYRLDRFSAGQATFTIWQYASDSVPPHGYRRGALKWTGSVTVSLPLEFTDDSESNLVQLSHGPAARTK